MAMIILYGYNLVYGYDNTVWWLFGCLGDLHDSSNVINIILKG